MKLGSLTLAALLSSILVLPAMAQSDSKTTMQEDEEVGYEYGYNPPAGQYRFNKKNTSGWAMMSTAEKNAYHQKMWNSKSMDECKIIQSQNQDMMMKRAQEKGKTMVMAKTDACVAMQKKGKFK